MALHDTASGPIFLAGCLPSIAKFDEFSSAGSEFSMLRSVFQSSLPWLLLANLALAADTSAVLPVGSHVMAKRPGVHFRIENQDLGQMHAGIIERVQKVQGGWLWLGRGWVQKTDVVPIWEAVEYFTAEIERKPMAFAFVSRAAAAGRRGAFPTEIHRDIDQALELDPEFAAAHFLRGAVCLSHHELDRAIDAYDDAVRSDPSLAEAYDGRAGAWWSKGRADKAFKDVEKAIRLCPRLAAAYANRGTLLLAKGDYDQALASAKEALKHDAGQSAPYVIMGQCWAAKADDQQAIAAYDEALRLNVKDAQARLERGRIYSRQGEYLKAIVDLNQAVQLSPKNAAALQARAYVYYRLGAVEKSNADRLAAARLDHNRSSATPNASEASSSPKTALNPPATENLTTEPWRELLKQAVTSANQTPTNSATLSPPAADKPETKLARATTLNNSAWRCATSSDERYLNAERAVEFATEACELTDWKRAAFVDTLAAAYAEAGDFEQAIKWQTKALELAGPNSAFEAQAEERLELYRAQKPYREDRTGKMVRDPNAGGDVQ
jgi:tetratricopeptide (TPR) repeat protein